MPAKLTTTVAKIAKIPNKTNSMLIQKYYEYMKQNGASENHLNNQLKAAIAYAKFLGPKRTLLSVKREKDILDYLDTKVKPAEQDPEKRWITTWNDNVNRIKRLFRWLHNQHGKKKRIPESDWKTPEFAQIRLKKTNRLSPYSETEIWERNDILTVVKYIENLRDKTILTLFWDLDARNHEVTLLKIKHVRLKECYDEGEIPYEAKTGSGPILLTCSFTYVRDWLQIHPDKDNPEAPLICNMYKRKATAVRPDAMWQLMHDRLRPQIKHKLETGEITDPKDREILEILLKNKKWNPYCIRHSAITQNSDYLPGYVLNTKVRWSMVSEQPKRYIKRRMGRDITLQLLARDGIIVEDEVKQKPVMLICSSCKYVDRPELKNCVKCDWPLNQAIVERIKGEQKDVQTLREQMDKIQQELALIRQNPGLAHAAPEILNHLKANVKPEVLGRVQIKEKVAGQEITVVDRSG